MGERVEETRIITAEGLSTCLDPGRGWTITSGGWNFHKKARVLGRPRASANYNYSERNKTNRRVGGSWIQITNVGSITSTAAEINSATRMEGEAAMSAPPFFQSVGQGDLLFWGQKEGPTVVIWESLSEQEENFGWKSPA